MKPACSIPECEKPVTCRGWCEMHYTRWRKWGDPSKVLRIYGDPVRRFRTGFVVGGPDECWEWQRTRAGLDGYGSTWDGERDVMAHRFSYELHKGPIPDGLIVRHTCDNPPCVNPAHLLVGTHSDNTRDMYERGRHSVAPSRRGGAGSANKDRIREVWRRSAAGESQSSIAAAVGLSRPYVNQLVRGRAGKSAIKDCTG